MWSWIAIGVSAVLFGRVFCGWVCPGGLVAEIIAMAAFTRNAIKGFLLQLLNYTKYIVLAGSLFFFFILNNPRWAIPIRTGDFWKSVALTFEHADPIWMYRTVAVIVLVVGGLVIPHLWCRFFCPTGGALELIGKLSLFRYSMNEGCTSCGRCLASCSVETRPAEPNCINCGDCVSSCEPGAIGIVPVGRNDKKERVFGAEA